MERVERLAAAHALQKRGAAGAERLRVLRQPTAAAAGHGPERALLREFFHVPLPQPPPLSDYIELDANDVRLAGAGGAAVARVGDPVSSGTISSGSTKVTSK